MGEIRTYESRAGPSTCFGGRGALSGIWSTTPKCRPPGSLAVATARASVKCRSGSQYEAMLTKTDMSGGKNGLAGTFSRELGKVLPARIVAFVTACYLARP